MPMQIFKVHSRQQHNTYIISEKLSVSLIYFNSHNRNIAVFVTDAVAVVAVVNSTSICSCGFAVVRFYAVVTRLRLFDPSLIYIHVYIHIYVCVCDMNFERLMKILPPNLITFKFSQNFILAKIFYCNLTRKYVDTYILSTNN